MIAFLDTALGYSEFGPEALRQLVSQRAWKKEYHMHLSSFLSNMTASLLHDKLNWKQR